MNKILRNRLFIVIFGFVVFSVALNFVLQRFIARDNFLESSRAIFSEVTHMLHTNDDVIATVKRNFKENCRLRARIAAALIENDRSIIESHDRLIELAELLKVDEVHIFDESGTLIGGTVPSAYGMTVFDGEQIKIDNGDFVFTPVCLKCYLKKKFAKEEIVLVLSFLEMLDKDNLHHCSIAKHLKSVTDETRIDYDDAIFMPFIDSPKYKILQTLKGNRKDILSMSFEETQQKHRSEIESLVVGYGIDEFKTLFLIAKESVAKSDHNAYEISQGLRYAFDAILNESSLYVSVVELYIQMDTPCNIHPSLLIRNLFDIHFVGETKKLIEKYDFSEKNTWLWCYYAEMPKENITQELCTELLSFLSEPDISIKSASYRPIDSINKYKIADEEIIVKASRILSENYDKSPFVFDLYFVLLFNPHNISVSNLFEMYASDHSLLEDIYLKSASYSNHCDYDGTVLMNLLDANPDVLNKYLNTMLLPLGYRSEKYESCMNRLEKIWLRDDFINIADMVVHSLHTIFVDQKWEFEHCLESFLTKANGKERSASNQDKWIIYCIENNYNDIEFMSCLFGAISEMSNSRRKDALIKFISLNDDYEAFERIQLETSSWGGTGSMIPYMQARIEYLSSLMPVLSGVKYLKHKQRIEHEISVWEERIKREEINELLEQW